MKEKPGWRMSLLPLPSILTGAVNSIPSARSKGKACGGWSWLHVLTPKRINAWAPTLSFLHQTPQLIPGLFHVGRMTCLVTAHTGRGQLHVSGRWAQDAGQTCPSHSGGHTTALRSILVLAQVCSHLLLSYVLLIDKHNKTSLPQLHHQLYKAKGTSSE